MVNLAREGTLKVMLRALSVGAAGMKRDVTLVCVYSRVSEDSEVKPVAILG